jgi:flavin reductase (DIM6/NTAB) family NADH-FMN oxidoreductase RutF
VGKLRVDHLEDRDESVEEQASGAALRAVMACFPTGVTVVAARDSSGEPIGLTVNSFTSVSLEPPLVLICIGHGSSSHDPIIDARGFTISVLSASQGEVAMRFATRPSEGRFDDVEWRPAPSGHPVIEGAAAWLDCVIDEVITAGDHSILLGRTVACGAGEDPALVFHRGVMGSTEG